MTSEERKALRRFSRAVREVEAAYEDVKKVGLDKVVPVASMAKTATELAKVNERRRKLTSDLREALILAGVHELNRPDSELMFAATVGAQILALLGR